MVKISQMILLANKGFLTRCGICQIQLTSIQDSVRSTASFNLVTIQIIEVKKMEKKGTKRRSSTQSGYLGPFTSMVLGTNKLTSQITHWYHHN